MAIAIESNGYSQIIALKKHWLPNEPETAESLSQALWLDKRFWENQRNAITNGIAKAFKG